MDQQLEQIVQSSFVPIFPMRIGVAVSGGSDSLALLHLLQDICSVSGAQVHAVTVDHGLREGSADEAARVATHCKEWGIPHQILQWEDWSGQGNLQNEAREARYRLIADWAAANDIKTVALGHTSDDQAETVLMRLSRRSGVDGLAGIAKRKTRHGVTWVRPLLECDRTRLRAYLEKLGVAWIEDPSNADLRFERVKMRQGLAQLAELGITRDALTTVANNMAEARKALCWQTFMAFREIGCLDGGAVVLCLRRLRTLPDEIQRRMLVQALRWINSAPYPARREAVLQLIKAISEERAMTLDGCHMSVHEGQVWIFREYQAVQEQCTGVNAVFDHRWRLLPSGPVAPDDTLEVRALGETGLAHCANWRDTGRPRVVLKSSPGVWKDDTLIAAPLADPACTWRAELEQDGDSFIAALLSH